MELTRVIETLSELSVIYDEEQKGVNIIRYLTLIVKTHV